MISSRKTSFIVICFLVVGAYAALAVVVSLRVASAEQLSLWTKVAVWSLLWGFMVYAVNLFVRYYKKLGES
jgi:hypothetical protein